MRYHYLSTRMAKIETTANIKGKDVEQLKLELLVGVPITTTTLESYFVVTSKAKHVPTL